MQIAPPKTESPTKASVCPVNKQAQNTMHRKATSLLVAYIRQLQVLVKRQQRVYALSVGLQSLKVTDIYDAGAKRFSSGRPGRPASVGTCAKGDHLNRLFACLDRFKMEPFNYPT